LLLAALSSSDNTGNDGSMMILLRNLRIGYRDWVQGWILSEDSYLATQLFKGSHETFCLCQTFDVPINI